MIVVDDMNDWLGCLGGLSGPAREWTTVLAYCETRKFSDDDRGELELIGHSKTTIEYWQTAVQVPTASLSTLKSKDVCPTTVLLYCPPIQTLLRAASNAIDNKILVGIGLRACDAVLDTAAR